MPQGSIVATVVGRDVLDVYVRDFLKWACAMTPVQPYICVCGVPALARSASFYKRRGARLPRLQS